MGTDPNKPRSAVPPALILGATGVVLLIAGGLVLLESVRQAQRRSEARIEQLEQDLAETRDQTRATGKVLLDLWKRMDSAVATEEDPEVAGTVVPELDASRTDGVVILSDARHRVYVVSLGSTHGIRLGQRIQILRAGAYVTEIVIDSVQPTASAGTTPKDRPREEIREGDRAIPVR